MNKIIFPWRLFWSWLIIHVFVFCVDILILKYPADSSSFIEGNALYFSWFLMGVIALFVGYMSAKSQEECSWPIKITLDIIWGLANTLISFCSLLIIQNVNSNYVDGFLVANMELGVVLFFTTIISAIYFQNILKILKKRSSIKKFQKKRLTKNKK